MLFQKGSQEESHLFGGSPTTRRTLTFFFVVLWVAGPAIEKQCKVFVFSVFPSARQAPVQAMGGDIRLRGMVHGFLDSGPRAACGSSTSSVHWSFLVVLMGARRQYHQAPRSCPRTVRSFCCMRSGTLAAPFEIPPSPQSLLPDVVRLSPMPVLAHHVFGLGDHCGSFKAGSKIAGAGGRTGAPKHATFPAAMTWQARIQLAVAQKAGIPKWNPGKWQHEPTPA